MHKALQPQPEHSLRGLQQHAKAPAAARSTGEPSDNHQHLSWAQHGSQSADAWQAAVERGTGHQSLPADQHDRRLADGRQASTTQISAHQQMPAASALQELGHQPGSWPPTNQHASAAPEPAHCSAKQNWLQRQALAKLTRAVEQQPRPAAQASVEMDAATVDSLAQRVRTKHTVQLFLLKE